jgi:hypothetical protein
MKWLAAAGVILAAAGGTSSCSGEGASPREPQPIQQQSSTDGIEERKIMLHDGTVLTCITWVDSGYSGDGTAAGIDCDWASKRGTK